MTRTGRRHFGSVRKLPSGRWQASYWHEGDRHLAPTTFLTKADALAHLATVETDLRRGAWIDPRASRVTPADYSRSWLANRSTSGRLAERTVELYGWLLSHYILPTLGQTEIGSLRPSTVREWHASVTAARTATGAKAYRLLSAIMRTAVTDGIVASSPCRIAGGGVEISPERPVATIAEVDALVGGVDERLKIVVLLATWCQLRRGELLGLRRRDIDLGNHVLHVRETRTRAMNGRLITKAPKSGAGRRTLAIPPNIMPALNTHLELFVGPDPDALILTGEKGRALEICVWEAAWKKVRRATGLTHLRLHDLRHTGLTWASASGASVAELMHRGGHSSPRAALRYQHATEDRDRAIAEALGRLASSAANLVEDHVEPTNIDEQASDRPPSSVPTRSRTNRARRT
jgi:integrase